MIEVEDVHIRENLLVEVQHVGIEDCQTKKLRGKIISLVKVVYDRRKNDSTWDLK